MNDSRYSMPGGSWTNAAMWKTFEDVRTQFLQSVDKRMRRGDVRTAVLTLLAEHPMHGYQIIQEIEQRSGGSWKPSAGSVYPTLQLLVDEGLVSANEADGRRTYSLTEAGRDAAAELADRPPAWANLGERLSGPRGALAKAGLEVAKAAAEVARTGTPEQIARAEQSLEDTARALRAIVAQD